MFGQANFGGLSQNSASLGMNGFNNLGQSVTGLYQNMAGSANLDGQIGSLYGNQAMNVDLGKFESNKLDFGMKLGSGSALD